MKKLYKTVLLLVVMGLFFLQCSSNIQNIKPETETKTEIEPKKSNIEKDKISQFLKPTSKIYCYIAATFSDYGTELETINDIYLTMWGQRGDIYLYGDSTVFNYEDENYFYQFKPFPTGYLCYRFKKTDFSKEKTKGQLAKYYTATQNLNVRSGPGTQYNKVCSLPWAEPIYVLLEDSKNLIPNVWVKILIPKEYGGGWGWVYSGLLYSEEEAAEKIRSDRIKKYGWSSKITKAVLENKIMLGMTRQQVIESWGHPDDINESVGSWGVHEQWVYRKGDFDATYLYFENGILKSWQD